MARDGERGRGDWKARPGSQNSGPYAEAAGDTGPVDIAAVRRDDALIDAISGDGPVQTGTSEEYQLAALLADWRAEIMAEPLPAGPDLDAIVAAVNQEIGARQARIGASNRGRLRLVRPLLGAAAAAALILGGLTAFSYNASPGDPLWRMKEVVFSEQAQSTVVSRADDSLAQAKQLLAEDKPEEAKKALEKAADNASQVNDSSKKDTLNDRWQQLFTQLQQVAPTVAESLATLAPTTTKVPVVTTTPNNPVPPVNPTTGGGSSTTVDPRVLGTNPDTEPNPTTGGGVSTLPTQPPVTTVPVQPSSEPSEPATPPTAPGTTTAVVPTGVPTGGATPPTQPATIEKPTGAPVVPTTLVLPTGGAVVPPAPGPTH
ncbi:anti-sigma-D factor RsdA [Nocardia sp. CDC160]|uniref:anti-sigma-D factor RsdA n=1 Tax=Nocardia sp. CDC160 TaxID=3112166 RepID=UPI002DB6525D|nr:anti-sigma-D factor RsdA [Nocardia sp. CDC160]MEC3913196.1 anti-sigma-D factor RsdA [Nocardia sp. CDC160]